MNSDISQTSPSPQRGHPAIWLGGLAAALIVGGVLWMRTIQDDGGQSENGKQKTNYPPVNVKPPEQLSGPAWFEDVVGSSGIDFVYRNGQEANQFTMLESLGGGVALLDYDGDGLLDIFLPGGGWFDATPRTGEKVFAIKGHPCKLYRNRGGWKFEDVTRDAGLAIDWWYTHGAAVADYDRDGWPDLLVTGYGRIALFHNEPDGKGGRRFVDVTDRVGLKDNLWSTSAGWADLDGDGFPDLYVCHYLDWSFANHPPCPGRIPGVKQDVCSPENFKPLVHALYRNEKGKAFRDVSAEQGFRATGCGLGVVIADLNDDGAPDIYVANDTNNNFLYFNRRGRLEEKGLTAGAAVDENGKPNASMGVDAADYDGSGRPSLWTTNFQSELHALYRNNGQERFDHKSRAAGTAAVGHQFVGFGTVFVDADNDGWEDLVFVNGHVYRHPPGNEPKQRPVFMRNEDNQGRRFYRDASAQAGPFFQTIAMGRGLAVGDLDNDGWSDLVISHSNGRVAILRNKLGASEKQAAHWLGVKLVGREHRDVVGSTVILAGGDDAGRSLTRFAKGGGSYLSANDSRILFGLGSSPKSRKVTVKWTWGKTETWDALEPDAYWELREGEPAARRLAAPP